MTRDIEKRQAGFLPGELMSMKSRMVAEMEKKTAIGHKGKEILKIYNRPCPEEKRQRRSLVRKCYYILFLLGHHSVIFISTYYCLTLVKPHTFPPRVATAF